MIPAVPIEVALADQQLLGAGLGDLSSWETWIAALKAAYGRPLSANERKAFDLIAGGRAPPTRKVRQFGGAISRRGGKGRAAAATRSTVIFYLDRISGAKRRWDIRTERRPVWASIHTWAALDLEAEARGVRSGTLLRRIVETVMGDKLIGAVLDDDCDERDTALRGARLHVGA